ncbi:hypothetical protein OAF54_03735, partial [bacterium]|nr:hypothetical protein [bacterium]
STIATALAGLAFAPATAIGLGARALDNAFNNKDVVSIDKTGINVQGFNSTPTSTPKGSTATANSSASTATATSSQGGGTQLQQRSSASSGRGNVAAAQTGGKLADALTGSASQGGNESTAVRSAARL